MEAKRLEQLRVILEKNYGFVGSDAQVFEIGSTLLNYFEILLKNEGRLYEERDEDSVNTASKGS